MQFHKNQSSTVGHEHTDGPTNKRNAKNSHNVL